MEKLSPYSVNLVVYDDCLNVLSRLPQCCIDLIYIDPPFYSGSNYKTRDGNDVFTDKWSSLDEYLDWLLIRISAMRQILKETGSIYVHLDWHASHYVKVRMDGVFGINNFQNEIIWGYRTGGISKKHWPRKHDVLLLYSKTDRFTFNALQERIYYDSPFFVSNQDEQGRYYADVYIRDVWDDELKPVINVSNERTGYPTQKPKTLLERIIKASSNENDIVADFFCGSGTTLVVAERLGRKWFGCDVNSEAVKISLERIEKERAKYPLF